MWEFVIFQQNKAPTHQGVRRSAFRSGRQPHYVWQMYGPQQSRSDWPELGESVAVSLPDRSEWLCWTEAATDWPLVSHEKSVIDNSVDTWHRHHHSCVPAKCRKLLAFSEISEHNYTNVSLPILWALKVDWCYIRSSLSLVFCISQGRWRNFWDAVRNIINVALSPAVKEFIKSVNICRTCERILSGCIFTLFTHVYSVYM